MVGKGSKLGVKSNRQRGKGDEMVKECCHRTGKDAKC